MKHSSKSLQSILIPALAFVASPLFAEPAKAPDVTPAAPAVAEKNINLAGDLKDSLVQLQNDKIGDFDSAKLGKVKYFAIYYSASWCGPCRKFTPDLVAFYKEFKPKHPEFELILVSRDRTQEAFDKYITTDSMPWPAVKFSAIPSKNSVTKYAGNGIPCLVLIDSTGKVVSNSFEGGNYVGPRKVMNDIKQLMP